LEKAPNVMKFFCHAAVLELVLDWVCVVWAGCFEKFPEMVLRPPRLALEVVFGSQDTFLTGVASFLITTAVASHYDNAARAPLLPLLGTLGTFPRALASDLRWCCPADAGGRFHIA
jgi:hypothetical protein